MTRHERPMAFDHLLIERDGPVAIVAFNRAKATTAFLKKRSPDLKGR